MTPAERMARADAAKRAWDDFMAPMFREHKSAYQDRMLEVANTELNRDRRTDKITALSNAIKVLDTLEGGFREIIRDGEIASAEKIKAERIEQMSDAQQRLLKIGVGY